jgi:hypothetical protein
MFKLSGCEKGSLRPRTKHPPDLIRLLAVDGFSDARLVVALPGGEQFARLVG